VLAVASVFAGCLITSNTGNPSSASPYTDEDAGYGYLQDFSAQDLASGVVLPGHFHPQGYENATIHGRDLKWQVTDCRTCHGQDLTGGTVGSGGPGTTMAPNSCDSCHESGWRTDCTYCHGTPGGNGAPPLDLDGTSDPAKLSFPGHPAHTSGRLSAPFDCNNCHRKPTDVLSPYHVFDASPRRAENNLTGGLSTVGVYDPVQGKCFNLYCHGTGRGSNGTVDKHAPGPLACSACHADMTTPARWSTMTDHHSTHLVKGNINCTNCHVGVSSKDPGVIDGKTLHVNGKPDVGFSADSGTMQFDAGSHSCTGTCHNEVHDGRTW
jgi:hypothetical protein